MTQPQVLATSTFNYIKPSNEPLETSGWMSMSIPSFFRKPVTAVPSVNPGTVQQNPKSRNSSEDEEDGEPFDLSDEEIDAVEAYTLNQGIPRELSISGNASKPPKTYVQPLSPVKVLPEGSKVKSPVPVKQSVESNLLQDNVVVNNRVESSEIISPTTGFFSKLLFNGPPLWWSKDGLKDNLNNDSTLASDVSLTNTFKKEAIQDHSDIDPFVAIAIEKSAAPPLPAKPSKNKISAIRVLEASNKKMRPGAKLKRTPIKNRLLIRKTYESARDFLNTSPSATTSHKTPSGKTLKVIISNKSDNLPLKPVSPPSPRPTQLSNFGARKEKKWKPDFSSFDGDLFSQICTSFDPESIVKPLPVLLKDSPSKSKVCILKLDPLPTFSTEGNEEIVKRKVKSVPKPLNLPNQDFFDDDDDLPLGIHYPNSPLKAMFYLEPPQPLIAASTAGYGKVTRSGSCPDYLLPPPPLSPVQV